MYHQLNFYLLIHFSFPHFFIFSFFFSFFFSFLDFFCPLQLTQKDPDEIEVERDFTIRKKIKGIYNKSFESFETALEFRNYEEIVEDVIYNLVNNIDVDITNAQVEAYQKGNLQQVRKIFLDNIEQQNTH